MSLGEKPSILVIDDDSSLCALIERCLVEKNMRVRVAGTRSDGLDICKSMNIDVVLLDQQLPDGEGWELCPSIRKHNDHAKIIFITAYPSFENALRAIKSGAYDYLPKPFELEEMEHVVARAAEAHELEKIAKLAQYKRGKEKEETVLIGERSGLAEIAEIINKAASVDAPVLITGETGSGKNVVARAIHHRGVGRSGGFVSINCASMPENLFEAELFGYDKGAFTGASAVKRGLLEMAQGGTLFLDEIGAMPFELQSKLLSVLEERRIRRVGGVTFRPIEVRIIAATNIDIEAAVRERRFRDDLYYRLNVLRIHIPPLKKRTGDIPALCTYMLTEMAFAREPAIPHYEMERLMAYDWPGNVRELKNVLERAALLQKGDRIRPSCYLGMPVRQSPASLSPTFEEADGQVLSLQDVERLHIAHVLDETKGNYARTARILEISLSTLRRRIKQYGLARPGA